MYVVTLVSTDSPDHQPYCVGPFDTAEQAEAWVQFYTEAAPIKGATAAVRPVHTPVAGFWTAQAATRG